jgi:hypothetical protein
MGIPIFEKRHSLLQSSGIPERIWTVVGEGDSQGFYQERQEHFFSKENRSENILDSNEDSDR